MSLFTIQEQTSFDIVTTSGFYNRLVPNSTISPNDVVHCQSPMVFASYPATPNSQQILGYHSDFMLVF